MFYIFVKACKKYKFDFEIITYGKLTVTLKPSNTFETITIDLRYGSNVNKLFRNAIKKMKEYRKERGYR